MFSAPTLQYSCENNFSYEVYVRGDVANARHQDFTAQNRTKRQNHAASVASKPQLTDVIPLEHNGEKHPIYFFNKEPTVD
jgi:hypothetical protein